MLEIRIKSKKTKEWDIHQLDNIKSMLPVELMKLAVEDRNNIRNIITSSKVRPDTGEHKLENTIDVEEFLVTDGYGVGVGNISVLDRITPYWAILNFGGQVRGHLVPVGAFAPGEARPVPEAFRSGVWGVGAGAYSFVAGKKPIRGIGYIERSYIAMQGRLMSNRVRGER